ncbi:MAG: hypothetical protein DRH57_07135 [Candidatus Cloacimonadota bacterium]|nr:MAG: hypothetical protein DRH57_07135 [Candidatus Cloacimonadota bacterium]
MSLEDITPLQIRNKTFSKSFYGYKVNEVFEYLSQLADIIEKNNQEIELLKIKINDTENKLQELEGKNKLIERALIMAESIKDKMIKNAEKEASNIIEKARLEGEDIVNKAISTANKKIAKSKNYLQLLEHDYVNLKERKKVFISQFSAKISALLELLKEDSKSNNCTEKKWHTE